MTSQAISNPSVSVSLKCVLAISKMNGDALFKHKSEGGYTNLALEFNSNLANYYVDWKDRSVHTIGSEFSKHIQPTPVTTIASHLY